MNIFWYLGSTLVESFDCDLRQVRTENFTKQIVSGTLYKFDLVLRSEVSMRIFLMFFVHLIRFLKWYYAIFINIFFSNKIYFVNKMFSITKPNYWSIFYSNTIFVQCGGDEKVCNLVVFDQPWTETREVRWDDVKCDN